MCNILFIYLVVDNEKSNTLTAQRSSFPRSWMQFPSNNSGLSATPASARPNRAAHYVARTPYFFESQSPARPVTYMRGD